MSVVVLLISTDILDKPRKQIYSTVDPTLAASLEPLAHC